MCIVVICIFSVDDDADAAAADAVVAALFLCSRDAELNMRLTGGKQKLDYLLASIADYSAPLSFLYYTILLHESYMVERGIRIFSIFFPFFSLCHALHRNCLLFLARCMRF